MRTDLYGLVHKSQRYQLFKFAEQLADADFGDTPTRLRIDRSVRQLADLLHDHAQNEHRYIHPLFEAVGQTADALEADHRALEQELAAWVALVDEQRWSELYLASMRLIGTYLLHIDAEERAQAQWLWPHYSDAQLGAVLARFKSERDPRAARADLELFITTLGTLDLVQFLGAFATAPSAVKHDVFALAERLLGSERWANIVNRLA